MQGKQKKSNLLILPPNDQYRNKNCYDKIFTDDKVAAQFLIDNNYIPSIYKCDCSTESITNFMVIKASRNYLEGRCYECPIYTCRKQKSIKSGTMFEDFRVRLHLQLRIIWFWGLSTSNYSICNSCEISESTYIRYKSRFISKVKEELTENVVKIGGLGRTIQVDETPICRGQIITNPSSALDNIPGTTWLVGGIEEGGQERIFLEIVPDRTKETLKAVFEKYVIPGTLIKTDGFASYPWAVSQHGSTHEIVNHSEGFTNAEGVHTNNIENLWSHLKVEIRTRRGIMRVHISLYIYEFQFRRLYLR